MMMMMMMMMMTIMFVMTITFLMMTTPLRPLVTITIVATRRRSIGSRRYLLPAENIGTPFQAKASSARRRSTSRAMPRAARARARERARAARRRSRAMPAMPRAARARTRTRERASLSRRPSLCLGEVPTITNSSSRAAKEMQALASPANRQLNCYRAFSWKCCRAIAELLQSISGRLSSWI